VIEVKVREHDMRHVLGLEAGIAQPRGKPAATIDAVDRALSFREPLADSGVDENRVFAVHGERAVEAHRDAILIVGGLGSALGAVLGTIFIILLPEATRFVFSLFSAQMDALFSTGAQELKSMLYGVVIILFLRFQPRGLVGGWHDIRRLWVNWPLRY